MTRVGFLGLGIMGRAMARRLVDAGFPVAVWNRTDSRVAPLVDAGAVAVGSPREAAESCDVTFAMVSDPEAARAVCFGPDGVLAGIGDGRGYVDMSTVDPATPWEIAAAIEGRGGRFLEAPVSGSRKPAEDGTLVILAAGSAELFREVQPAFDAMGKKSVYLGVAGNAARMKLAVNTVMGGMMTAFSEGLRLAAESGLDPEALLDVLDTGAIANPMFRIKGPAILAGEHPPNFPLKHMQKDLALAVALGDELGVSLPTAATANELFKWAMSKGAGDEDFAAVARVLDR